ncbi:LysM peptidoglycan-binding domain-containing protein [Aureispira anguillae]|uniref:LysM peptidoglycan-binding domain-containing protein n=1 Tax=Aureispira anguillae TaxID=2864201 RepID=A0A916DU07_9BACT|nr:LysM peptidoglycan-binding domain-containing protein [Aureispira anguillae]BDS12267.1 LysM peptidoglycan-binding domain-containing protein [Aureispira anguillae]
MKVYYSLFFLFLFQATMDAQTDGFAEFSMDQLGIQAYQPKEQVKTADSLYVQVENGQKYLLHTIHPGQTLYAIKKFYGIDLSDIYYSNPNLETNGLKIGQKIRIPLVNKAIKRFVGESFVDTSYIPVYYKVRTSETLYRISKIYFRLPSEILKSRNQLVTDHLSEHQILHIGWIDKKGIPDSLKNFTGLSGILGEESQKNKYRYEVNFNGKNEQVLQGTACWDKAMSLSAKNKLYVMCSYVPKGGVVKIENPMTNRHLYAKVVAPKPENSFTQESIVMLTPTVAKALGGLDSRFYVKVSYCK